MAVDVSNMLQLYASMLHERRVIVTSSKLSTVSTSHCPLKPPAPGASQKAPRASADSEMSSEYLGDNIYLLL